MREFLDVLECIVFYVVEKINFDEREEMKVFVKLFIVGLNFLLLIRSVVDMVCLVFGVV